MNMAHPRMFLDTADIGEIRDAVGTGIVDGVATNPEKLKLAGLGREEVIEQIRSFFDGPIAVEAVGVTADEIEKEALRLSGLSSAVAVKIPANYEGIKAVSRLAPQGVLTNATLIFNPGQGLAAGLARSPFISPFVGRARMAGHDGISTIGDIRRCYDAFGIDTCIIAASIKDVQQVIESIKAGAHSVAVTYPVFRAMLSHPATEAGIQGFQEDWKELSR